MFPIYAAIRGCISDRIGASGLSHYRRLFYVSKVLGSRAGRRSIWKPGLLGRSRGWKWDEVCLPCMKRYEPDSLTEVAHSLHLTVASYFISLASGVLLKVPDQCRIWGIKGLKGT